MEGLWHKNAIVDTSTCGPLQTETRTALGISSDFPESCPSRPAEFTAPYHFERNHQGIANKLICPDPILVSKDGAVKRRERLGRLLNYYYRTAA